jgi:hypothetical protein
VPPAEVDGGPTTMMEGDYAASLTVECRPVGTWVERPQKVLTEAFSPSLPPCEHDKHPPPQWRHSRAH